MAVGKGGGIGGRLYEDGKSLVTTIVVCTAILCALFGAPKGINLGGKAVDTLSVAVGATWTYLTGRAPDGVKKGNQLAAGPATGKTAK